jgi:hypothetical protein
MKRSHRAVHRLAWPVLAVLVMFGIAMALVLRPPPMPEDAAAPEGAVTNPGAAPDQVPEPRP